MSDTAEVEQFEMTNTTRRFELGDLTRHGPWMLKRYMEITGLPEAQAAGWLRSMLYSNEHMFLYQDRGAALAQIIPNYGIKRQLIVHEIFVWLEDKEDKKLQHRGRDFYAHFVRWGKLQGADMMIVMENSDVPQMLAEQDTGRIFKFETRYARIK